MAGSPDKRPRRASIGPTLNKAAEEAILDAAAAILDDVGYRGFSLDAVVRRAGSSKPTIYRRWRNKGSLIMAVYERAGEAALSVPDTGDLRRDLIEYLTSLWRWWTSSRSGEALRSFLTEAQFDPLSVQALRDEFCPRREVIIRSIIGRAVQRREIADVPNEHDAAVGLLIGLCWLRLLTDNIVQTGQIVHAVDIVALGLSRPV